MKLETTKGLIDEEKLRHEQTIEEIPCGKSITDAWYLDGELVKQDVRIEVDTPPSIGGTHTGVIA